MDVPAIVDQVTAVADQSEVTEWEYGCGPLLDEAERIIGSMTFMERCEVLHYLYRFEPDVLYDDVLEWLSLRAACGLTDMALARLLPKALS